MPDKFNMPVAADVIQDDPLDIYIAVKFRKSFYHSGSTS